MSVCQLVSFCQWRVAESWREDACYQTGILNPVPGCALVNFSLYFILNMKVLMLLLHIIWESKSFISGLFSAGSLGVN